MADEIAGCETGELGHGGTCALWVCSFLDELVRCGVRAAVVSPGSRSTPLAMAAFELSCRRPDLLRLYVDVDERGAAFFGLGMAKAGGGPVALICTSGTAVANYYPAVIEAETSRVPLVVLTGDRPPRLQGLGAPQTTDQLKIFGDHVRAFRAMPLPAAAARDLAFARQAAREAVLAATGGHARFAADGLLAQDDGRMPDAGAEGASADAVIAVEDIPVASFACEHMAGPVHLNFPFDEPLKPDFPTADAFAAQVAGSGSDAFSLARAGEPAGNGGCDPSGTGSLADFGSTSACAPFVPVRTALAPDAAREVLACIRSGRALVLAGEGSCSTLGEAREVVAWARKLRLPVLADPLSGLRSVDAAEVMDAYDTVFSWEGCPVPEVVIRFGRYPISKRATKRIAAAHPRCIVVDEGQTRDYEALGGLVVPASPIDFVRSCMDVAELLADGNGEHAGAYATPGQEAFMHAWTACNDEARARVERLGVPGGGIVQGDARFSSRGKCREATGVFADEEACSGELAEEEKVQQAGVFEGAVVRAVMELAPAGSCVFAANSMAVRAVDNFYLKSGKPLCLLANRGQNGIDGTVSTAIGAAQRFGQTTFITGDLTLQHDLGGLALQNELLANQPGTPPTIVIVLLNNDGGAIFDMLPQASDDPYFERLFLAPQRVDFEYAALAFGVPYRRVETAREFADCYRKRLCFPGISLIEVRTSLRGVKERYGAYWS